jgi:hypothetical protein
MIEIKDQYVITKKQNQLNFSFYQINEKFKINHI